MLKSSEVDTILPGWDKLTWYYSVELANKLWTKGYEFNNISMTRKMLESIDLRGTTAFDNSAMEGSMSVIMAKRGASVMATDAINREKQIELVRRAHDVDFSYFPEIPLHRLSDHVFDLQSSASYIHGMNIGP
jgi:2-polyprenyl-3-methyl-5-hydroxy-6-metoxy-1,4-benzoquinol methylase